MIETRIRREAPARRVYSNLPSSSLQEIAVKRGEGIELATGTIDVDTRPNTGRSPKDSFVVEGASGVNYGDINQEISDGIFENLTSKARTHLERTDARFDQKRSVGADARYNIPVLLQTEKALAAQFVNIMFLPRMDAGFDNPLNKYIIYHTPSLALEGEQDGVKSEKAVITNFNTREILIAGTGYLGEIKKRMFGVMQYELPLQGVATMHCSANMDKNGKVNLYFGLSGTGKTTHSADKNMILIGDDEHGWSSSGIFNFENGSYAKLLGLDEEKEPLLYKANRKRGALSENGAFDLYLNPVYDTGIENMRGAAPLSYIENSYPQKKGEHPSNIFFLTADASGVIPPISKLSPEQAIHHYLQGYTSKVAGTEIGVTKPEPTFSACFGGVFLPLPPEVYARLLAEKIATHQPTVTLINTGWPGGHENGRKRMEIADSRRMIEAVRNSEIESWEKDSLGFLVPKDVEGINPESLRVESYWEDQDAYRREAQALAGKFDENIAKFKGKIPDDILSAGPHYQNAA